MVLNWELNDMKILRHSIDEIEFPSLFNGDLSSLKT